MIVEKADWYAVDAVVERLRPEDVAEIVASSGCAPETVLHLMVEEEENTFAIRPTEGAAPVALFGVLSDRARPGWGTVWLVATRDVSRHSLGVLKVARESLVDFLRRYPKGVHNLIDNRNTLHRRWVRLLGFSEGRTINMGGHPFTYIFKLPEGPHV